MSKTNILWGVIGLIAGGAAGSVTTYFVMKAKCDDIIEEQVNERLEAYYDSLENEQAVSAVNPPKGEDEPAKGSKYPTLVERMNSSKIKPKKHDYTKHYSSTYKTESPTDIAAKYEHPEDDDPDEKLDVIAEQLDNMEEPHIIKPEDMGGTGNDMIDLSYYLLDGSLVEGDEEVFDVDRLVGDCLDKYLANIVTDEMDDIPSLYVRNELLAADYEITFYNEAYAE